MSSKAFRTVADIVCKGSKAFRTVPDVVCKGSKAFRTVPGVVCKGSKAIGARPVRLSLLFDIILMCMIYSHKISQFSAVPLLLEQKSAKISEILALFYINRWWI